MGELVDVSKREWRNRQTQVARVVRATPFSAKSISQLLETSPGDHS